MGAKGQIHSRSQCAAVYTSNRFRRPRRSCVEWKIGLGHVGYRLLTAKNVQRRRVNRKKTLRRVIFFFRDPFVSRICCSNRITSHPVAGFVTAQPMRPTHLNNRNSPSAIRAMSRLYRTDTQHNWIVEYVHTAWGCYMWCISEAWFWSGALGKLFYVLIALITPSTRKPGYGFRQLYDLMPTVRTIRVSGRHTTFLLAESTGHHPEQCSSTKILEFDFNVRLILVLQSIDGYYVTSIWYMHLTQSRPFWPFFSGGEALCC